MFCNCKGERLEVNLDTNNSDGTCGSIFISIPGAKVQAREEFVKVLAVVPQGSSVTLHAGKRKLTLKPSDLEHYHGERGRRGNKLPRGLQRVDEAVVELTPQDDEPIEAINEE